MIRAAGERIEVEGVMTLPVAAAMLAEGRAMIANGANIIDLAAVTEVDSSGISVIFGWLREARSAGKSFHIANPPGNFLSLAAVYGVTDQLPLA
jgi:phospholipid transport system transporter-binding protein